MAPVKKFILITTSSLRRFLNYLFSLHQMISSSLSAFNSTATLLTLTAHEIIISKNQH